ncbi:hypothetical protein F5Y14DRAFT_443564 [Nemania sp. NC0429]|nr:hypothetical protein F5Y14DRAFT_443564 [Nemania sp. NC0429]
MQPGRYQVIRPTQATGEAPVSAQVSGEASSSSHPRPKRPPTQPRQGACYECRSRKTKCDGARPACAVCRRRGITACVYPEKRGPDSAVSVEVIAHLKALPPARAAALVHLLREKGDPGAALSSFRGGTDRAEPRSLSPPSAAGWSGGSMAAELTAKNAKTYPALTPIDPAVLARSGLLQAVQPSDPAPQARAHLSAAHDKSLSRGHANGIHSSSADTVMLDSTSAMSASDFLDSLELCDERLRHLQVSFWTDLDVPNDLVARVISLYIKTDHPLLGLFNPRLLIGDLVNHQMRFCNRFLFHSLMYIGCQMYSAFDRQGAEYATQFCEVAESLWRAEDDSCVAMAGAVLLSVSLLGHGRDHAVLNYGKQAMEMGHRLGLFVDDESPILPLPMSMPPNDDELSARSYATWGVFNWSVMLSVFYRQPGSETPKSRPKLPIPTEAPDTYTADSEEDESAGEVLFARNFPLMCHFWTLVHKVNWIYYTIQNSPPVYLRLRLVEYTFREFLAWVEDLPPLLLRGDQQPHHTLVFHIWLHTAILDMFQPFINKQQDEIPRLATFSAGDNTPDAIYRASLDQLKHLVVEYRSRHPASTFSLLWHTGLIYLANGVLAGKDPEWHLYFLLCIYAYERLNRSYRISEIVTRGLLSMAMRDTNMTGSEASGLMQQLQNQGLEHIKEDLEDRVRATFMVDLNLALTNPEAANVEKIAADFNDLAIFQDLMDPNEMD